MAKKPRAYYRATARACLHCGATLEGRGTPAGGTAHTSPTAFVGFVQVRYRVYTCPQCGRQQTRGRRTTWGGDGKY
jgi:hypothetical protein